MKRAVPCALDQGREQNNRKGNRMQQQLFLGDTENGRRLIGAVRSVAAERPDHIYVRPGGSGGSCMYVQPDENGQMGPGCLIGQGLWRAGFIDASLYDSEDNRASVRTILDDDRAKWALGTNENWENPLSLGLSDRELAWLDNVQDAQDSGNPWGRAVQIGDWQDYYNQHGEQHHPDDDRDF